MQGSGWPLKLTVRCMAKLPHVLAWFLVALLLTSQLLAADVPTATPSTTAEPRMVPNDVLSAAKAVALKRGIQLTYYAAKAPIYRPRTKDWDVLFVDSRLIPDSNFSVVISDLTKAGCLMTGLSPSCT